MRLAPQAPRLQLDGSQGTAPHKSIFTRQLLGWIDSKGVPVIMCNPSFLFKARKNQRLGGAQPPQYHIYSNNNVSAFSPAAPQCCFHLMIINTAHDRVTDTGTARMWFDWMFFYNKVSFQLSLQFRCTPVKSHNLIFLFTYGELLCESHHNKVLTKVSPIKDEEKKKLQNVRDGQSSKRGKKIQSEIITAVVCHF